MERVVVGTREIVQYHGHCPDCGKEQVDLFSETNVDIPCWECSKKRKEAKIKEKYKNLIGATIVDVFGCDNLDSIRVKTLDGEIFDVQYHHEFGREDEYLIVEEKSENKKCSECGQEIGEINVK